MRKIAYYFLLTVVFTVPWQGAITFEYLGTISRVLGLVSIFIAMLVVLIDRKVNELPLALILMGMFVVWNILSYLWSVNPTHTLVRVVTYAQLLAMVWLVWELCKTSEQVGKVMQVLIFGMWISMSEMLLTYFTAAGDIHRVTAAGFNPNRIGLMLSWGIPIAWYLSLTTKSTLFKILNAAYLPAALFCIVLTASRSAFISALVACLIIPFTIQSTRFNAAYISSILIVGLIVLFSIFIYSDGFSNLEQNVERLTGTKEMVQEGQLSHREVIWQAGFKVFSEHALIGVGAGSFGFAVESILGGRWSAHNTYLSILVDTGIVGLILFISTFIIAFIPNLKSGTLERNLFIILFLALAVSFIPNHSETDKTVWLIVALSLSNISYVIRNSKLMAIKKSQ